MNQKNATKFIKMSAYKQETRITQHVMIIIGKNVQFCL